VQTLVENNENNSYGWIDRSRKWRVCLVLTAARTVNTPRRFRESQGCGKRRFGGATSNDNGGSASHPHPKSQQPRQAGGGGPSGELWDSGKHQAIGRK